MQLLSYPTLFPKARQGLIKRRPGIELNQIRSAKRSSLGSAFRARKRDSAATFPITLLYGVRRVIRPVSRIPSIYVQPKYAGVQERRETRGQRKGLNPCTLKSGPQPYVCVLTSKYIIKTRSCSKKRGTQNNTDLKYIKQIL